MRKLIILLLAMPIAANADPVTIGFDEATAGSASASLGPPDVFGEGPITRVTGPVTEDGFTFSVLEGAIGFAAGAPGSEQASISSVLTCGFNECDPDVFGIFSTTPGEQFRLVSLAMLEIGEPGLEWDYENLPVSFIEGFLDGVLVAEEVIYPIPFIIDEYGVGEWASVAPSSVFAGTDIDELRIRLVGVPTAGGFTQHVWVDDIVLDKGPFNVPEPGTLALLGLGLVGMAARRRKTV